MNLVRTFGFWMSVAVAFSACHVGWAQSGISEAAVSRATQTLNTRGTAEYCLGFMHMGATYVSHQKLGITEVKDRYGKIIPGEFAVVYMYEWDAAGPASTKVAFLCDRRGTIESIQIVSTSAILHQPFQFAQASSEILGSLMLEALRDHMTEENQQIARRFIDAADMKGLLEVGLQLRQVAGIR